MKAELRRLHSPDAPDLTRFMPSDPRHFGILVQAMIGLHGERGEESFAFVVCTPGWIAGEIAEKGFLFGRHYLLLDRYDVRMISEAITGVCLQAKGRNWSEIAHVLARFGKWEFEDYREEGG